MRYQLRYFPITAEALLCLFIVRSPCGLLLVLTKALNVYGTLHLEALYFRGLVELLTTTEFLHYASLLEFSLKFLESSFNVFALFYRYYNHVCFLFYLIITLILFYLRARGTCFRGYTCGIFLLVFTSFTLLAAAKLVQAERKNKYLFDFFRGVA